MARKLEVVITGNSRDLERAMGRAGTSAKHFGVTMGDVAKVAAGAIAAIAAAAVVEGKRAVSAYSDLQEQIGKTGVVFGSSAAGIQEWSKTTASSIGVARDQALQATGTFGNMLVPMGLARPLAAQMSQRMVQLSADMASFNNASPEDTLLALRSGLAGEAEPLRQFGVFLDAARIKQEALNLGLVKGKGDLTAAQKAAATYSIILKDTADAQGDFARTSGGLANQQRVLRAQIRDLEAGIGKALYPAVTKVVSATTAWLGKSENMERVTKGVQSAVDGFGAAIRAAWPEVQKIARWIDEVVDRMGGWENAFKIVTGGALAAKVLSLSGAFGSKGLMGSVTGSTAAIGGKGGLLMALRALPAAVSIAVILELFINDKGVQKQVDAALDRAHDWALKNLDPFNMIKGLGLDSRRTPYPSILSATPEELKKVYGPSSPQAGTTLPSDWHGVGRTSRRTSSANGAAPHIPSNDTDFSDLDGGGDDGGGGDGGGKSASSAREAARKLAADRQQEAWQNAIDTRKMLREQQGKTLEDNQTYEAELAATARKGAADRQQDAWQASIDARKAKQAERASLRTIIQQYDEQYRADAATAAAAAVQAAQAAVDAARGPYSAAFARLGQSALSAFDAVTGRLQRDLAKTLSDTMATIEATRSALTPEEQAVKNMVALHEQAARDKALADARASGDAAAIAEAEYNIALAAAQDKAAVSRAARDKEAAAQIAAAQTDYDRRKLELDAQRELERGHFEGRLTELSTFLSSREGQTTNANAAIKALFQEFGVDPAFAQAGVDLGSAFADGLNEQLDTVIAKARQVAAALAGVEYAGKVPAGVTAALAKLGAGSPGGVFMGGPVPSFDTGGQVLSSGVAFVHKGEVVTAAGKGSTSRGGDTFIFEIGGRELVRFTYAELLRQKGRNVSLELA